jgi:hypothetical protein
MFFMEFADTLKLLAAHIQKMKDNVHTEEAAKTAFVMPFIQALGYDIFNPSEVVPEFVADIGIKQGEKIDYAIVKDAQPILLIECKGVLADLEVHGSQLFRYYATLKAKFAILTNGIEYRFFADLDEKNKMDLKPFLTVNITDLRDNDIDELSKFHKTRFNFENILSAASELKYTSELKSLIAREFNDPHEELVKYFTKNVYQGVKTAKILDQFTLLLKKSFAQYTQDLVNDRLKAALQKEQDAAKPIEQTAIPTVIGEKVKIETTPDKMEAVYILKSILRSKYDTNRVGYKDSQSYFVVQMDHNSRLYICRFYFSENKKVIGLFDESKHETKYDIKSIDELYQLSEQIIASADAILKSRSES